VSREFREGLKLGAVLQAGGGNIRDPNLLLSQRPSLPPVIDERSQDEEEAEEAERDVTVASRAALWDRKVAEELG